jgi:hypothetical protein
MRVHWSSIGGVDEKLAQRLCRHMNAITVIVGQAAMPVHLALRIFAAIRTANCKGHMLGDDSDKQTMA